MLTTIRNKCDNRNVLVSGCVAGSPCRYNGTPANLTLERELVDFLNFTPISVCPEQLGGLTTPRPKAEIQGGNGYDVVDGRCKVNTETGRDVTSEYMAGARETLEIAIKYDAGLFISQRRSPSCSCRSVYDGTFSRTLIAGPGVTTALLERNGIDTIDLEALIKALLEQSLKDIVSELKQGSKWSSIKQQIVKKTLGWLPPDTCNEYERIIQEAFLELLPELIGANSGIWRQDSDTVRFLAELFREYYGVKLLKNGKRCCICSYPEGFLDCYIGADGVCSVCNEYKAHKSIFENFPSLRGKLFKKIEEIRSCTNLSLNQRYDAILACSGGKDSIYAMYRLRKEYGLRLLCVMDMLSQQTEIAINNAERAAKILDVDLIKLDNLPQGPGIRKNFILAGSHFCRLCLRAHFVRIYEVALSKQIPLIFYGTTPYQCYDCVDSVTTSLRQIQDVDTPYGDISFVDVIDRYIHRSFQGGFDVGFITDEEKLLLDEWRNVFKKASPDFAPLMLSLFVFDDYPGEQQLIKIISRHTGWQQPEIVANHTNCKFTKYAAVYSRALGAHHINYKERATALRLQGYVLSDSEMKKMCCQLELIKENELVSRTEFVEICRTEFNLLYEEIPDFVRRSLDIILE